MRTGIGFDAHPFAEGRPLVLGGVEIPHGRGLAGWSDADALLHALTDALLGAAALGDIGRWFPPGDTAWAGAESRVFLREAAARVRAAGWRIENVDATVLAEAPMISPHVSAIIHIMSEELAIAADRVSVKATTLEGLGFVGRREGIAALAIATLSRERGSG